MQSSNSWEGHRTLVDKVANQFDRELYGQERPLIESYLEKWAGPGLEDLYTELLREELEYLAEHGERPAIIQYRKRFPQFRDVTDRIFPARLGEYELLELLGIGGFGRVYRAKHEGINYAVKLLSPSQQLTETQGTSLFRQEFQVIAKLKHPRVVQGHYLHLELGGVSYLAMDYVEGVSLQEMLHSGEPISIDKAITLVTEVGEGLDFAHNAKLVHRDLKPANILVDQEGHPYITDFGLALLTSERKSRSDRSGTTAYMSPEAIRGEALDGRTDLWSLGTVFYQLLTGGLPFVGDTEQEIHQRIQNEQPVSPHVLRPSVSDKVSQICLKCLEKDRDKRWETAHDFVRALQRSRSTPNARTVAIVALVLLVVGILLVRMLPLLREGRPSSGAAEVAVTSALNPAKPAFERAESLAAKQDWSAAIVQYREAIRLNPSYEPAHLKLALALEREKNIDGALAEVQEAIRLSPNDATAHVALGTLFGDQGLWDREVVEEQEAVRLNPELEAAHVGLGAALGHEGKVVEAIKEERRALQLDSGDALAHRNLGALLAQQGDWEDAVSEAREAVRLNPADAAAHLLLGMGLERKRDLPGALQEYGAAIKLDPTNAEARGNHERVSGELKDYRAHSPALPPSGQSTLRVIVRGEQPWTDTRMSVARGQSFIISAVGAIRFSVNDPPEGPSGSGLACNSEGRRYRVPFIAGDLPCHSLLGRVGSNGTAFEVGNGGRFTAPTSGELYLGVNDNFFPDNSGAWTASITVTGAQTLTPPSIDLSTPQVSGLTGNFNGVMLPTTTGASIIKRAHWSFGDGATAYSWFPATHTYARPGTYTVTATVVDSNGLTATASTVVTVGNR